MLTGCAQWRPGEATLRAPRRRATTPSDIGSTAIFGFLKAALAYYASLGNTVVRVMTHNGSCYPAQAHPQQALHPKTNGKAERFIQTALREWAYAQAYRRLFVLLRREGEPSGKNRIYRLYREEGLTVRKRRIRRRAVGTRAPILVEARVNARWSLDFVHDQLAGGRLFRILNVVDDVTRECLAAIADTSISGRRVARDLTALIQRRGRPGMIVSDNVLSGDARALFRQQISFAGVPPVDQY